MLLFQFRKKIRDVHFLFSKYLRDVSLLVQYVATFYFSGSVNVISIRGVEVALVEYNRLAVTW